MGLFNNIFAWFMHDRLQGIEAFATDPFAIQRQVLSGLLRSAADTEWGRRHRYHAGMSCKDFSSFTPISDYDALKPYIDRTMKGEESILWPGVTTWFAKSSGTTGDRSKFIPVTREALQDCHFKAGKDMYALYYEANPNADLADGKSLVLGGSHQISHLSEGAHVGDLSAILLQNLPIWAEMKRVPKLDIALMDKWEDKVSRMAEATINQPVSHLLGVPTWTVVLIKKIFELTGKNNLMDVWPNLELYVHGGVSFEPYRDLFKDLIKNDDMHYLETYNASEGYFAIQDQAGNPDLLLMLDYGIFYEFIPTSNPNAEAVPLEGVEVGKNYAVIISTNAGLWRYALGDTVTFTGTHPYRIRISGRTKHFINAFGEELMVDNADKAISQACKEARCVVRDYTAAPIYFTSAGNGAHQWLFEFEKEPSDLQLFKAVLDQTLRKINSDYDAKRQNDIALRAPEVTVLPDGTFYRWLKEKGKLGGQHKVPRLLNNRNILEEVLVISGTM